MGALVPKGSHDPQKRKHAKAPWRLEVCSVRTTCNVHGPEFNLQNPLDSHRLCSDVSTCELWHICTPHTQNKEKHLKDKGGGGGEEESEREHEPFL